MQRGGLAVFLVVLGLLGSGVSGGLSLATVRAAEADEPGTGSAGVSPAVSVGGASYCAAHLEAAKAKLGTLQDQRRRMEAKLLLDKAVIEENRGRFVLCAEAVDKASQLLN